MKKLSLKLNQQYKSFPSQFNYNFEGDLIVISGVNGSGKSQLIDIIRQTKREDESQPIAAEIKIGEQILTRRDFVYRSFKENSPELTQASTQSSINAKNHVWNYYKNSNRLDINQPNLRKHSRSALEAKAILIKEFGDQKFNSGAITNNEIQRVIPSSFMWKEDDVFSNFISDIFFNYASKVHNAHAKANRTKTTFDESSLPDAPWKELNNLFKELKIGYRFKDDYRIKEDSGFEIDEQPMLHAIKSDGSIDLSDSRSLSQLSDGEKAIISLSFASLSGATGEEVKALLLDEYDATFNPSLTEMFFKIVEKYFVSKGIMVIIVTHSPATISLAPEYTRFYEVFRPIDGQHRILPANRGNYAVLRNVMQSFYDEVGNPTSRMKELEEQNELLKKEIDFITDEIQKNSKLSLITEGNNADHIEKAIQILKNELLSKIEIVRGAEDKSGAQQLKNAFDVQSKRVCGGRAIFVWDCDVKKEFDDAVETESCKKFRFKKNEDDFKAKKGIENLYPKELFTDDVFDKNNVEKDCGGTGTFIELNKKKFLEKIKNLTSPDHFRNFQPLIDRIVEFLEKSDSVLLPQEVKGVKKS